MIVKGDGIKEQIQLNDGNRIPVLGISKLRLALKVSLPCVDWPFSLRCLNLSDGQEKNFMSDNAYTDGLNYDLIKKAVHGEKDALEEIRYFGG